MKGGDKTIPTFNVDAFDPKIPNEQKEIMHPKTFGGPSNQGAPGGFQKPPFLTIQVAEQPKPKPAVPVPLQFFPSATVYPAYAGPGQSYQPGNMSAPVNVVNQLVIGDQNPYQNHQHIHMIYEDVLPMKHLPNSLNTLSERLTLFSFIKGIILQGKDGETIPFRNGPNNLFDKLKATELNPYHLSDISVRNNPYLTLPKNMLIYRSCYPIKRDESRVDAVTCAPNSIGMNLRLYRLTQGEMMINRNGASTLSDSEVWREIMYYEYVRENIIRRKQSPNFVMMIGYALCNDSEIDFEKIEELKHNTLAQRDPRVITNTKTNIIEKNPNAYNNDILTAITESPTYSLVQWASTAYANVGKTKRMINTGFKPDDVWFSIIFQILSGFYVMQKHGIHINRFNLRDNVYIKDLSGMSNITSYWKYIIDDVSYYIPNYGYLAMFDSKFKDLTSSGITVGVGAIKEHKIVGTMFNDPNTPTIDVITDKILDALVETINMNNFGTEFIRNGGVAPSEKTQNVIDRINQFIVSERVKAGVDKKDLIGKCIFETMRRFVNNRVGTLLTKQEQDDINRVGKGFSTGDVCVYEEGPNVFKFVIYVKPGSATAGGGTASILTKSGKGNDINNINVPLGSLYEYSKAQPVKQNYKPNEAKLDESDLLETYNLTM